MHSAGIDVVLWAVWARGKEPHQGPVTPVACLLYSGLQLNLVYILLWLAFCVCIFRLLSPYPLCWMVVLSILLQDGTPKCFCFFFLRFFEWHLFFTKVSEELFVYCLQTSGFDWIVYFFLHISWFFWLLLEFHFQRFSYCLHFLVCCYLYLFLILCFFWEIFWDSPFCAMSVRIDSSALMLLIWVSNLVFHFGYFCYYQLNCLVCLFDQQLNFSVHWYLGYKGPLCHFDVFPFCPCPLNFF